MYIHETLKSTGFAFLIFIDMRQLRNPLKIERDVCLSRGGCVHVCFKYIEKYEAGNNRLRIYFVEGGRAFEIDSKRHVRA